MNVFHPSYLTALHDPNLTRLFCDGVKVHSVDHNIVFDAVVGIGTSGMMSVVVGYTTTTNLVVVRKSGTRSHASEYAVQGPANVDKFVIVDDLIDSGATVLQVLKAMKVVYPKAVCTGIYLYGQIFEQRDFAGIPVFVARNLEEWDDYGIAHGIYDENVDYYLPTEDQIATASEQATANQLFKETD